MSSALRIDIRGLALDAYRAAAFRDATGPGVKEMFVDFESLSSWQLDSGLVQGHVAGEVAKGRVVRLVPGNVPTNPNAATLAGINMVDAFTMAGNHIFDNPEIDDADRLSIERRQFLMAEGQLSGSLVAPGDEKFGDKLASYMVTSPSNYHLPGDAALSGSLEVRGKRHLVLMLSDGVTNRDNRIEHTQSGLVAAKLNMAVFNYLSAQADRGILNYRTRVYLDA